MKKLIIKLFNLLFLAGSAFSMAMMATQNFLAVDLSTELPKEFVVDTLSQQFEEIEKEKLEEALSEPIKLNINISIPGKAVVNSIQDKTAVTNGIKESINNTVGTLVDDLHEPLMSIIEVTAKSMAKEEATKSIKDQMAQYISGEGDKSEEVNRLFEEKGLEQDVETLTNKVYDALTTEGTTIDSLVDTMVEDIDNILNKLSDVPGFENAEFKPGSPEAQALKDSLNEALDSVGLVNEDGTIKDADSAIAMLLNQLLNGEKDEDKTTEEGQKEPPIEEGEQKKELRHFEDAPEEEKSLKEILTDFINDKLTEMNIYDYVDQFGGYIVYVLLFFAIPWVLFIIVTIFRTLRRRKCWTKPWIVFTFAFYQLIIGVVLTYGLKMFSGKLVGLFSGSLDQPIKGIVESLSLSIKTATYLPSIVYLAFVPLTIIYIIICHGYKKEYKNKKRAKKHGNPELA